MTQTLIKMPEDRGGLSSADWASVFDAMQGYPIQIEMAERLYIDKNTPTAGWTLSCATHARISVFNSALKRRKCPVRLSVVEVRNKWWATNLYALRHEIT